MYFLEFIALILILYLLYGTSNTLKYYLKFAIYYGGVILNSFILFPYLLLRPTNPLNLLWVLRLSSSASTLTKVLTTVQISTGLQANFAVIYRSSSILHGLYEEPTTWIKTIQSWYVNESTAQLVWIIDFYVSVCFLRVFFSSDCGESSELFR